MKNYFVNEGNHIGGQEPQALGTEQKKIKASADIVKGQLLEVTGSFTVGPASDKSAKVVGVAFKNAETDAEVVIECEGFMKFDATAAGITAGDKLVSGGAGKVRTYNSETDAGAVIIGTAFNTCAASGVVYSKLILG